MSINLKIAMTFSLAVALTLGGNTLFAAASTEVFFFSHDSLGSITSISDAKNQLVLQQGWNPWGKRLDSNRQSAQSRFMQGHPMRLGYTGHKQLLDANLVVAGDTRLYDPELKRFYNTDDRTTGGVRGHNRFTYTYNNPLLYVDPDGHVPVDADENRLSMNPMLLESIRNFDRSDLKQVEYAPALPSEYPHIVLWRWPEQNSHEFIDFMAVARTNLSILNSKPYGRILLRGVNESPHRERVFHGSEAIDFSVRINQYEYMAMRPISNFARNEFRQRLHAGCTRGAGGACSLAFNSKQGYSTGNLIRPRFISLAHELVHVYRHQYGYALARYTGDPIIDGYLYKGKTFSLAIEELETVGLLDGPTVLSENLIRSEHSSLRRVSGPQGWVLRPYPIPFRKDYSDLTAEKLFSNYVGRYVRSKSAY